MILLEGKNQPVYTLSLLLLAGAFVGHAALFVAILAAFVVRACLRWLAAGGAAL